jgi:hypothetical protein
MAITKATASSIAPAAKGDLVAGSATNDAAVLTVGANDTVLTADSSTATGLKWATPGGAGANWSLLNAGGTSLSGTSTSITGISGQDKLLILVTQASTTSASNRELNIQFNSDTGSNYIQNGIRFIQGGATALTMAAHADTTSSVILGQTAANAGSWVSAYLLITGCNAAGVKEFNGAGSGVAFTDTSQNGYVIGGVYTGSSTISSVQIKMQGSTFDLGTVFIYGSA